MVPIRRRLVRLTPRWADCGLRGTARHGRTTWPEGRAGNEPPVARYAHVDRDELFDAAGRLEQLAAPRKPVGAGRAGCSSLRDAGRLRYRAKGLGPPAAADTAVDDAVAH
jgi:hypothetical protein